MGGGIALQVALRSQRKLAGAFALSSYLCERAAVYDLVGQRASTAAGLPPVFMRHGTADGFILPAWGRATAQQLETMGVQVDFALVPHAAHELKGEALDELREWLGTRLDIAPPKVPT